MAHLIVRAYAQSFGLPAAITRCGNMYDGGDLNWNRAVPGTIRSLLRGQRSVIRSDGGMRRDCEFVLDIVDASLTLAEAMEGRQHSGEAFNFGLDSPLSVLAMVQAIIAEAGRPDLEPLILNEVRNEIQDQYLSSEKARRTLGWRPQHTLQAGLHSTIGWYREFLSA